MGWRCGGCAAAAHAAQAAADGWCFGASWVLPCGMGGGVNAVVGAAFNPTGCRRYHPDRNPDKPDAEEKFREIAAAYEVLAGAGLLLLSLKPLFER